MDVSNALKDDSEVTVVDPQLIHVQSGDLIGFAFKKGNPIPYDHSFKCGHHGRVAYSKNTTVPVGGIISFIDKNDDQLGCRLFSLFVKIEVQGMHVICSFVLKYHIDLFSFIVSTRGIQWILWFSVRYAATARRENFGVNALRGKLHQLGSPNLQDIFIGGYEPLWD